MQTYTTTRGIGQLMSETIPIYDSLRMTTPVLFNLVLIDQYKWQEEVVLPFIEPISEPVSDPLDKMYERSVEMKQMFHAYVEMWQRQTRHLSSVAKMISHPAYEAIVTMGEPVVPLLLEELRDRPDHWFVALNRITNEDPVPPGSNFGEAVEAWLAWGRKKGYLC